MHTDFFKKNKTLIKLRKEWEDAGKDELLIILYNIIVPRFRESAGTLNLIRPSVCQSVSPSVCHKNFNLGHNFCTITGRALILGMCVHCHITFLMVPCRDLDRDL